MPEAQANLLMALHIWEHTLDVCRSDKVTVCRRHTDQRNAVAFLVNHLYALSVNTCEAARQDGSQHP